MLPFRKCCDCFEGDMHCALTQPQQVTHMSEPYLHALYRALAFWLVFLEPQAVQVMPLLH